MEREKIYYAAVIFISAVSILLSPFFYVRRTRRPQNGHPAERRWRAVIAGNILMVLALLAMWWFWLRQAL
ncbi:hypothetical protein [Neisseria dentiae]|uniref:hypothetical protein n=1 Tax=Neisseria dentiae TaxID=194197 RepID=UPI00359FD256